MGYGAAGTGRACLNLPDLTHAVSKHRPRPAQPAAHPRGAQQAVRAHAQPPATPHARRTRIPWRSSKVSPLASAHEMCWRWKLRKVRARRPPAEPACRAVYTPAISRR
eukprot:1883495-Prymnesium_polylepis.1